MALSKYVGALAPLESIHLVVIMVSHMMVLEAAFAGGSIPRAAIWIRWGYTAEVVLSGGML